MARERVQIFYEGRVQGVGFRFTVRQLARGYEVTGTIRNLSDGRVELIAEGVREELEEFLKAIAQSGLGHFVEKQESQWGPAQGGFRGFEIIS